MDTDTIFAAALGAIPTIVIGFVIEIAAGIKKVRLPKKHQKETRRILAFEGVTYALGFLGSFVGFILSLAGLLLPEENPTMALIVLYCMALGFSALMLALLPPLFVSSYVRFFPQEPR